ncbi:MAG: 6,7-dimethyl-8-ribityllumazine synthase [Bacteroidales bacterium]|nr:6,7-dimethyl-8-ribityllumazine synthase [Bacteroidales bacterium]
MDKKKNLSDISVPKTNNANFKIGIIVSRWNQEVTGALKEGAMQTLFEAGVARQNILDFEVPGSFELPSAAAMLLDANEDVDAVICLGCIIQGETRHFEFIAQAVADGIAKVGIEYTVPVIFGVLTCNTAEQAADRSGGKHGNKGVEAAASCLQMLHTHKMMYSKK